MRKRLKKTMWWVSSSACFGHFWPYKVIKLLGCEFWGHLCELHSYSIMMIKNEGTMSLLVILAVDVPVVRALSTTHLENQTSFNRTKEDMLLMIWTTDVCVKTTTNSLSFTPAPSTAIRGLSSTYFTSITWSRVKKNYWHSRFVFRWRFNRWEIVHTVISLFITMVHPFY